MSTETKAQWTPGPWEYKSDCEMIVSVHPEWNWSSIAKLASGEDDTQERANARLIAAAPELVEALQQALKLIDVAYYEESKQGSKVWAQYPLVQNEIRQALKKAGAL